MKPRLLLVAPYGIALRDVLMNEQFSSYLRSNFVIDVHTDLSFNQPKDWGIDEVIPLEPATRRAKFAKRLTHRAISTLFRMDFKRFHTVIEASELYSIFIMSIKRNPNVEDPRFELWGRVGTGIWGKLARRALNALSTNRSGIGGALFAGRYDLVLLTHPNEGDDTVVAQQAARAGVPTACLVMGMDNMQGGPILMDPELFLLWGPDQTEWLRDRHVKFRPSLRDSVAVEVGSLSHDSIVQSSDLRAFERAYPQIKPESKVVTFATYTLRGDPGQAVACRAILEFLEANVPGGHLVLRVRPGIDEEHWRAFAAEYPGMVTVQIPQGAFFSKWSRHVEIEREVEEADVALYGATLRRSSLVVTSTFSTVYVDSYAAGTPAITVGIPPRDSGDTFVRDLYRLYAQVLPYIEQVDLVTTETELEERLDRVLVHTGSEALLDTVAGVYGITAGKPDGGAGKRAAMAIEELMAERTSRSRSA